jgi:hypothetical protein
MIISTECLALITKNKGKRIKNKGGTGRDPDCYISMRQIEFFSSRNTIAKAWANLLADIWTPIAPDRPYLDSLTAHPGSCNIFGCRKVASI